MKLESMFNPRSIALIGASRDPNKVGHRTLRNIIEGGYGGEIYPINPEATELLGRPCYAKIGDAPAPVDLAIICVPARIVPLVAEECGRKGVRSIVVISAGFSETGREGTGLERQLVQVCRTYGMRMQGPNCLGLLSVHAKLNASFASTNPPAGNVAFISQSGALGSTILNWAVQHDAGLTNFVSLGNEADLDAADFIEAMAEDERTRVIALYIEGVKNGDRFIQVARAVTRSKPIIALKAGTTDVGIRAVSSHTGSLAGSDAAFTAAFRKAGILRVDTMEELFNLILAFEAQPVPAGRNVLIVTNGGGPGILAADACDRMGLELPLLERPLLEKVEAQLPAQASPHNPIDVLGDADEKRYALALESALASSTADAIIVILTPQAMTPQDKVAEAVVQASSRSSGKPIFAVFMGLDDRSPAIQALRKNNVPNYLYPEQAAGALRAMCEYAETHGRAQDEPPRYVDVDDGSAKQVIADVRREGRINLTTEESMRLASAYRIPVPTAAVARSREEAAQLADRIGYPIVLKVVSPEIIHKTDLGGVVLGIQNQEELERNYDLVIQRMRVAMPGASIRGVLVQRMYPSAREVIVGAVRDPQFGPLLMFGLGGIYVNFLRDVSYGLSPLTEKDAARMIQETKAYALLRGVRGQPPSDIESIIDVMLRLSHLMTQLKEVVEMEINPLFAYEKGCLAVDVRVTVSREEMKGGED